MKIWVIGRSYPQAGNNMMGSFELEQAKLLAGNGEEVHYLCGSLHPLRTIKGWGTQHWEEDGVVVHAFSHRFLPRLYPLYFNGRRNRLWSDFLHMVMDEAGRPDVIHVHYPAMLMIADALRDFREMGAGIFLTEHWTKVFDKRLDVVEKREFRKYFDLADACVCVGSPLAKAVGETIDDPDKKIVVIPNVVSELFHPAEETHEGFEFIAVGRLVDVKRFDRIIAAFAQAFDEENVKLSIAGGGKNKESLEKQIRDLGVQNKVTLLGNLSREDTAHRVAEADALVSFSRYETFGVPIIEAWACGIPAIATDTTGAFIDNFDERLGVQVASDSPEELRDAMRRLYEHKNDFDKRWIAGFAGERFSEKAIYNRLMQLYREARADE